MAKIPRDDVNANQWIQMMAARVVSEGPGLGLSPAEIAALDDAAQAFDSALDAHSSAQLKAQMARFDKDKARGEAVAQARRMAHRLRGILWEDAELILYGLDRRVDEPSRIKAPTRAPIVAVRPLTGQKIEIKYRSSTRRRGRPAGAIGLEIWVKVGGDPPLTLDECRHIGLATKMISAHEFAEEQIGQTAHFLTRWVTRRGLGSPVSAVASATIPL